MIRNSQSTKGGLLGTAAHWKALGVQSIAKPWETRSLDYCLEKVCLGSPVESGMKCCIKLFLLDCAAKYSSKVTLTVLSLVLSHLKGYMEVPEKTRVSTAHVGYEANPLQKVYSARQVGAIQLL